MRNQRLKTKFSTDVLSVPKSSEVQIIWYKIISPT